jgi:hypothetical protein
MQAFSVSYKFSQHFRVPAREAFDWATDYQPNDLALMGEEGKRTIRKVTEDTIVLKEDITHAGRRISKVKLVKLNPRALSWHNIHIRGPNKYSAFIYEITPEGKSRSRLTFTGLLVLYGMNRLSPQKLKQIAAREKKYDSKAWQLLAKAMTTEYQRKTRLHSNV